ncbi:unnamed protein product [Psylliodes chrysocephalus]|uniref:Uncharacterized protein n=1 Tax=Psylliodes chrysocephalus TaxID=3402493 RepID=A0A9P0CFH4_9CUCU|nr:unnamed protein product [Psylliodes chrysocephala]
MAKSAVQTRKTSSVALFGTEKDIDSANAITLPTYADVIRCCQSVRLKQKYEGIKQPSKFCIAAVVAEKSMKENIRELAVRRILKARNNKPEGVRVFRMPSLNFEALDYIDLIKWAECTITEPPLTTGLTHGELERFISKANEFSTRFGKFPCHTQAVERCVKLVTEAALKVCNEEARHGYIVAKLDARKSLPAYDNKGQYYK